METTENNNKHAADDNPADDAGRSSKKVKISDDGENDSNDNSTKATPFLEDIELIQDEIVKLNEKASEEILKVEQKFNKLRKPYYEKRNQLLKNIPQFWLQTLYNHPNISPLISDDEDCLNYLVDLEVEDFENIKFGYKIKMHFSENPYFKNEVLIKEIHNVADDHEQSAESTPIEYKDTEKGKNLKQMVEQEIEQRKDALYAHRNGYKSIFVWYMDPIEIGTDEIAEFIKDQIWPNPLEFYLAQDQGASENSEDEDDDDDESDDDDACSEEYEVDGRVMAEGELQEIDDEEEEEEEEVGEEAGEVVDDEEGVEIESGEEVEEFQQEELEECEEEGGIEE